MNSHCSRSRINVNLRRLVEDERRVRIMAKRLGAHLELVERIEVAGLAAPVFVQKHFAAANVVRLLPGVFQRVGSTHGGVKGANGGELVRTPTCTIAVVALDTNVEGIKMASFIFVRCLH